MTRPITRIALILALLLPVAGCHSVKLSQLRSDLNSTYMVMLHEQSASASVGSTAAEKQAAFDAALRYDAAFKDMGLIAEAALEAADEASKDADKVSFLQKAAVASWVTNNTGMLAKVENSRGALCNLDQNSFAPYPRDCAIIQGASQFAVATQEAVNLKKIEDDAKAVSDYRKVHRDTWLTDDITKNAFTDASASFNKQVKALQELKKIHAVLQGLDQLSQPFKDGFARRITNIGVNAKSTLGRLETIMPYPVKPGDYPSDTVATMIDRKCTVAKSSKLLKEETGGDPASEQCRIKAFCTDKKPLADC